MKKNINFYLGKIICKIKGYDLENFEFDFVGHRYIKDKSSRSYQAWFILNQIHKQSLKKTLSNPSGVINFLLLTPWILAFLINLTIHSICSQYLTGKYYYSLPESKRKKFLKKNIWGTHPGENWHNALENVYQTRKEFTKARNRLVEMITSHPPDSFDTIIEIGTGNGWFLNLISNQINRNISFIGIDLNKQRIEKNKSRYRRNSKLKFYHSDFPNFAKKTSLKNKLLLSCFVLEYFSPEELRYLAQLMSKNSPCHIAFIERFKPGHKKPSIPVGNFSFSHQYQTIFSQHGLKEVSSYKKRVNNSSEFNLSAIFKA